MKHIPDVDFLFAFCEGGGNDCPPWNAGTGQAHVKGTLTRIKEEVAAKRVELKRVEKIHAGHLSNPAYKQASLKASREYRAALRQQKAIEKQKGLVLEKPKPAVALTGPKPDDTQFHHGLSTTISAGTPLRNIGGGNVNETYKTKLDDGTPVIYKPQSGEDDGCAKYYGVAKGTLYQREAAVSDLDKALGFGIVPPTTVVHDAPMGKGSAQTFIEGAKSMAYERFGANGVLKTANPDVREGGVKMLLLDYMTGNGDRHDNNYMISDDNKLHAIDNGFAFSKYSYNRGNAFTREKDTLEQEGFKHHDAIRNLLKNGEAFDKHLATNYKGITADQRAGFWYRVRELDQRMTERKQSWTDLIQLR